MVGIPTVFPEDQYFAYYDPTHPFTILQAIDDLAAYVSAEGSFDGVMKTSHGAASAAMLLARVSPAEPFRFAVFLCAGVTFCEASLRQRVLRHLEPKVDKELIRVPTTYIVGSKDDALQASLTMKELCVTKGRGLFDHWAGHEVPVSPKGITGDMADARRRPLSESHLCNDARWRYHYISRSNSTVCKRVMRKGSIAIGQGSRRYDYIQ